MSATAEKLREELAGLSFEDRTELAHFLFDTLGPDEDLAWEAELDRRDEEILSGKEPGISGDQVFAELKSRYQ